MRVAILAYEAKANAGTEAGLAWQWANAYRSKGFDPLVITHGANLRGDERKTWEAAGVETIAVGAGDDQPRAISGLRHGLSSWGEYSQWIEDARSFLRVNRRDIGVAHQVAWGSARLACGLLSTGVEGQVWGPLGGGQAAVLRGLSAPSLFRETIRNLSIPLTLPKQRAAFLAATDNLQVWVTNEETERYVRRLRSGMSVSRMLADGVPADALKSRPRERPNRRPTLLWLGRMVPTKRPDVAIRVLAALVLGGLDANLTLAGDGPERFSMEKLARELQVADRVDFLGRVPWPDTRRLYDEADLLLFQSLRDSSCPTVVEAAARALPTVALRHQGVGGSVPDSVALGPTEYASASRLVNELAAAARELLTDDATYAMASRAALSWAATETWDLKVERVLDGILPSKRVGGV